MKRDTSCRVCGSNDWKKEVKRPKKLIDIDVDLNTLEHPNPPGGEVVYVCKNCGYEKKVD